MSTTYRPCDLILEATASRSPWSSLAGPTVLATEGGATLMDFSDGKTTTTASERIRARRHAARAAVMGDPTPARAVAPIETRTASQRIRAARHGR